MCRGEPRDGRGHTIVLYVAVSFPLAHVEGVSRSSTVIKEALCYKSVGHWFDSRWCHWNFSLT